MVMLNMTTTLTGKSVKVWSKRVNGTGIHSYNNKIHLHISDDKLIKINRGHNYK